MKKQTEILVAGCLVGVAFIALATTPELFGQNTAPANNSPAKVNSKSADATEMRIERIGNGIDPVDLTKDEAPIRLDIEELMKLYNVPGLSVAVIEDYKIAWVKSYGVTEPGGTVPVTPKTLFQAGSISKPVAAAGMLALLQQGKLSLDESVNHKLKSWQVPENEFTKDQKVTLIRLLNHSAGLTGEEVGSYAADEALPTLVQALNGQKPATLPSIRVDIVPGSKWRYSGGGY